LRGLISSVKEPDKDMKNCKERVVFGKALRRFGEYSTCVGFSAPIPGPVFPQITSTGAVATLVSVLSLAGDKAISFRNRWAMFSTY
jgi:hypothetical protein